MGRHMLIKLFLCLSTWGNEHRTHRHGSPATASLCTSYSCRVTNIPQFSCLKLPSYFAHNLVGQEFGKGSALWFLTWVLSEGGWGALIQKPSRT